MGDTALTEDELDRFWIRSFSDFCQATAHYRGMLPELNRCAVIAQPKYEHIMMLTAIGCPFIPEEHDNDNCHTTIAG